MNLFTFKRISFFTKCSIYFSLLCLVSGTFFQAKAQSSVIINTGVAGTPAYNAGPIYRSTGGSAYDASRYVYLYTASELAAAGITPWSIINSVGWAKSNSTTSLGPGIFRIYMRNTSTSSFSAVAELWTSLNAGSKLVYENLAQNIDSFVAPTYLEFPLDSAFAYNGGSLEIATEWDINSVTGNATSGTFSWLWSTVVDRVYGTGNTTLAPITSLSSTTNSISTLDDRRPFIKIDFTPGVTGIAAAVPNNEFSVSPNPAKDKLHISFSEQSQIRVLKLYNYAGQELFVEGLSNALSKQNYLVDVSALHKGIYFLQAASATGLLTRKVVIE